MRFPNFRHPLVALAGIWALLLVVPLSSNAEEDASTLSGRVVDMEGNPVSDLTGVATDRDARVFVSMIDGKWRIGTPESLQRIGIALLEKEDMQSERSMQNK